MYCPGGDQGGGGGIIDIDQPPGLFEEFCRQHPESGLCSGSLPPVVIQDQTQGNKQVDCRKRENYNRKECQEYWDKQDPPKDCPCPTNSHPLSSREFQSEEDLVCNLGCYNGIQDAILHIFTRIRGTDFMLVPYELGANVLGQFIPAGSLIFASNQIDVVNELRKKYGETIVNRGGVTYVRQPSFGGYNRATIMSTFVEEINHASHYHNLIPGVPPCERITVFETEAYAKLAAFLWAVVNVAVGDIPAGAFDLDPVVSDIANQIAKYNGATQLAFHTDLGGRCPGEEIRPTFMFANSLGCINSFVMQHLVQI